MTEPVFKLLRCDAEASHMLGWAKKEVRRLMTYAGLDVFSRKWVFGDVTVTARVFDGVARLWLEAESTESMAVWATLPNPVPYRGVAIYNVLGDPPDVHVFYENKVFSFPSCSAGENSTYDVVCTINGVEVGRVSGSAVNLGGFGEPEGPCNGFVVRDVTNMIGVGSIPVPTGMIAPLYSAYPSYTKVGGGWELVALNASYSDPFAAAITAARAKPEARNSVVVVCSDGEILAKEYMHSASNEPASFAGTTIWNGSGSVDIFKYEGANTVYDRTLTFEVPKDCIAPITEAPPAYPGSGTAPPSWAVNWAAAVEGGRERAREFSKKHTDAVLESMKAGDHVLPVAWDYAAKKSAPASSETFRPVLMAASFSDTVLSDSTNNFTQPGAKITQRATTLSYDKTVDGEVVTLEATITGTRTQTITRHDDEKGVQKLLSRVDEYADWYSADQNPTGSDVEKLLAHQFLKDKTAYGMGLFWSGSVQATGGAHFDSAFSVPSSFSLDGADYVPPLPMYYNTVGGAAPEFVLEYHNSIKPKYKKGSGNTVWLSSSLYIGATITIVPLFFLDEDEDHGMFGGETDYDAIKIRGAATYLYDYKSGALTYSSWTALPNGAESAHIQRPEGTEYPGNALIIYRGIKWDDVKEKARAQRKALNDPNDPDHDPLMKAVLDAMKPPEPAP